MSTVKEFVNKLAASAASTGSVNFEPQSGRLLVQPPFAEAVLAADLVIFFLQFLAALAAKK